MKLQITFKDPDGFYNSMVDAVRSNLKNKTDSIKDDDEREQLIDTHCDKVTESLQKWVKYNEYITVEFDTDEGTATVVPNN